MISFIIRNRNEERYIGYCIQSIIEFYNIILPNSTPEIIIVDNNSTDSSLKIVDLFKEQTRLKHLTIDDYTPGKALNLAVNYCSNDIILIISAHCEIKEVVFDRILILLDNYEAVWGKQIPIYHGKKIDRKKNIWQNFRNQDEVNYYSKNENKYFLHNALCFYKRDTLIKYPFDEVLKVKEDRAWVKNRIKNGGKNYYDSRFVCYHHYTNNGATWKD